MRAFLLGCAGLLLALPALAQDVPVAVPDTVIYSDPGAIAGTAFSVPVRLDADVTGRGISAADIQLAYDPAVLSLTDAVVSDIADGCLETRNTTTPGQFNVAIACGSSSPFEGSGVLVTFSGTLVAEGATALTLVDSTPFNEGGVPAAITDGRLRIVTDPDPSFGAIDDQTIDEDGSAVFDITLVDQDTDPEDITVMATASTDLVPAAGVAVAPCEGADETSACRTLTVSPAMDANGTTTVTVTADDNSDRSPNAVQTFELTVTPINDAPTLVTDTPDGDLPVTNVPRTYELDAVFADVDDASLTYAVSSSDEGAATITLDGTTATLTPVAIGTTTITLRATDAAGLFAEDTFDVVVIGGTSAGDGAPLAFAVHAASPNPAHASTTLRVDLPTAASLQVEVYDAVGRRVLATAPRTLAAGPGRRIALGLDAQPAGLYVYRVIAEHDGGVEVGSGRLTIIR